MEIIQREKGLELMSVSGIRKNCGEGPKLRQFATFKDLKAEKKKLKKFEKNTDYKRRLNGLEIHLGPVFCN